MCVQQLTNRIKHKVRMNAVTVTIQGHNNNNSNNKLICMVRYGRDFSGTVCMWHLNLYIHGPKSKCWMSRI